MSNEDYLLSQTAAGHALTLRECALAGSPVEAFNHFIMKWVDPKWHAHLLDEDTNDAERVRDAIRALAVHRRLSGQANLLLARIVAAANLGAIDGADGFIESYNLPVGPIHKAIPFLNEQGIVVTEEGQIKNCPEDKS